MQSHDLSADPAVANPNPSDRSTMAEEVSTPIHGEGSSPPEQQLQNNHTKENNHNHERNNENNSGIKNENNSGIKNENNSGTKNENNNGNTTNTTVSSRRERPSRACTARSAAANRLYASAAAQVIERKPRPPKKEKCDEPQEPPQTQCSKIVTPLVSSPPLSQLPRWNLRSMWELASILNFLNVFRPLLNISIEFSAEEFETALLMPNSTLDDIHIPLLKAIPPVTRMALGRATWVTVLCRKLRDWWHWVAEGDIPIIASHGAEVELYKALDPAVRVVILKALCDIRVEQEDIRNYIESSIKHGVQLSAFRKERIGGDSCGISYWYEDDPIIGHRLYRDTRKVDVKKVKGKNVPPILGSSYQWETVATNLDEFQDVSEKLFSSKNRTEASLGKKLKNDMLPEIEKVHKRKERLLKKQHRQALLLDNFINIDGLAPGRSLRDRKPVTYTFDDYDRSINEAIKITKKQQSPEPTVRREVLAKTEASTNGRWSGTPQIGQNDSFDALSPKSPDFDEVDEDPKPEQFDRSNRRRQRPQRYSERDFVEAVSDNDADFYSDEDIVGEAVYDEEYLKKRKQTRKPSSSSEAEGDDEYKWDEEKTEDDEEEEEEEDDDDDESLSMSDNSDEPRRRFKKLKPGRTRRETKLRSVVEIQSGLRRSKRATRNRIDYRQYEISDSENETVKPEKSIEDSSRGSRDLEGNDDDNEIKSEQIPMEEDFTEKPVESEEKEPCEKSNSPSQDEIEGVRKRRFLDLNELAPGSMKDEDTDDF